MISRPPVFRLESVRGFTLQEVLITVAIVGILAAIAVPSYQTYRLKTIRAEGKRCLSDLQRRLENFYTRSNAYTTDLDALGFSADCTYDGEPAYTLAIEEPDEGDLVCCYRVSASAVGGQTKDGNLVITYDATQASPSARSVKERLVDDVDQGWN